MCIRVCAWNPMLILVHHVLLSCMYVCLLAGLADSCLVSCLDTWPAHRLQHWDTWLSMTALSHWDSVGWWLHGGSYCVCVCDWKGGIKQLWSKNGQREVPDSAWQMDGLMVTISLFKPLSLHFPFLSLSVLWSSDLFQCQFQFTDKFDNVDFFYTGICKSLRPHERI